MKHSNHTPYSKVRGFQIKVNLVGQGKKFVKSSSVVGYCHYDLHKGYLTKELYINHQCEKKQCRFFEKFTDYPYWVNAKKAEQIRSERRRAEKERIIQKTNLESKLLDLAREAQLFCYETGYPVLITRIRIADEANYNINYVSDVPYDDWRSYLGLTVYLGKKYQKNFRLRRVKFPAGGFASIDDWMRLNGGIVLDIAPLYELKSRLRAAAIAGTSLLSEDFRLKKAAEGFKTLEMASPVFKKISEQTDALLSDKCADRAGMLLDTITLVDSVICTLGTTDVSGRIGDLPSGSSNMGIANVPYSRLSVITDALTASGSGKMEAVQNAWNNTPELFRDFRVMPALMKGLGASYAELAELVLSIVKMLGADMLPHLKMDFDPKGKKETVRRVRAIEEINGANESDFFIEQLENAEKDVRTALVYALRYSEDNIDKLIELVKTEKGKPRTAALTALALSESDKPSDFLEEYAKKKPVDVFDVIKKAHSAWASSLTARLIENSLVDKDGNKVTYSQLTRDELKLKNGADRWTFQSALWGKSGAEIEKIYREFDDPGFAPSLSLRLGEAIAVTGDEGLKKLAVELNTNSPMKGRYIYAEGVVRLLSGEDCTEWIRAQLHMAFDNVKNTEFEQSEILKLLRRITDRGGRYTLDNGYYDDISDGWIFNAPIPLDHQPISDKISNVLMEFPCWQFDRLLEAWRHEGDDDYRARLNDYFVKRFVSSDGERQHLISLNWLAARNVKGIMRGYCETHQKESLGSLRNTIIMLNGDDEYRLSETRDIVGLMKSGKLKTALTEKEIDELMAWSIKRHST